MSTNNQLPVKFTKIYTDGYQEDFEFENDVHRVLLTASFLDGKIEHFDELIGGNYEHSDWCATVRAYTPFVTTDNLCLYFVRYEHYRGDELSRVVNMDYVLKVEWER